ncbi:PREDICTED: myelin protein zero-like protein 1, partial [Buceros rhinoceros silvestris]|uniref:myelin protein zero-like protein 1 n=1 Tax=Buceros rhinoceros silvestris TaxID=175836 RepID=UPI0005291CF0
MEQMEELEEECNPRKCVKRRKRAKVDVHMDFITAEEAEGFEVVGTVTTSVKLDRGSVFAALKVPVSAVEVHTPEEIFVENGTDAKLPCTFTSVEVISSAASVSWSFQPEGAATRIS